MSLFSHIVDLENFHMLLEVVTDEERFELGLS